MRLLTAKNITVQAIINNVALGQKGGAYNAKFVPIKYYGPVGSGKSSIARQAAAEAFEIMGVKEYAFHVVNIAEEAPDDIAGSNYYDEKNGRMVKLKPWWFPADDQPYGVVFLDEYDQGDKSQQNAGGNILEERRCGPHKLPAGWVVIAAGNRKQDRAGTTNSPAQVKDRSLNCEIEIHKEDTLAHANQNGWNDKIKGFLRFAGDEWLHKFDPDAQSFPTPRSWEKTNTVMTWDLEPEEMLQAIASKIGAPAAAAFNGFCKVFDLVPDIDELIAKPNEAMVPDTPDVLYAVCAALSSRANADNLAAILQYCKRFEQQEFTAMIMRDVRSRVGPLVLKKVPAFREWVMAGGGKELLV